MHKALKHNYILEFIHSEIIDREREKEGWVPGLYILLELAVGGDLFDKIGESCGTFTSRIRLTISARCGSPGGLGQVLLCSAFFRNSAYPRASTMQQAHSLGIRPPKGHCPS